MRISYDEYLNLVKESFAVVEQERAKLTTAGCILAQQIDEIDLALQGVLDYDIVDDAGDALFAVAYIASVEGLDFRKLMVEVQGKSVPQDLEKLRAAAIGVISACAQYANYTLRKGVPPEGLFRRHERTLVIFLMQLKPFLAIEGKDLDDAIDKNILKLKNL